MLQPQPNPLIDERLVAASNGMVARSRARVRLLTALLVACILIGLLFALSRGAKLADPAWWQETIVRIAKLQFESTITAQQAEALNGQVREATEAQVSTLSRVQQLEALLEAASTEHWLRRFTAYRTPGQSTVRYEILVGNPRAPKPIPEGVSRLRLVVKPLRGLSGERPEGALASSISNSRELLLQPVAPAVADALQGQIEDASATHLQVILSSGRAVALESIIIPISTRRPTP